MKRSNRIVIRSYKVNIPAQFARITLEELGIDSSVEKDTDKTANGFQLIVDFDDAPLADEIIEQAKLYEKRFVTRAGKKAKKRIAVMRHLSKLWQYPN